MGRPPDVCEHVGWVRNWAQGWARANHLDQLIDVEDVQSYACEAALLLARRWDPNGTPFRAYLRYRLPNATVDTIRKYEGRTKGDERMRVRARHAHTHVELSPLLCNRIPDPTAHEAFDRIDVRHLLDALNAVSPIAAEVLIESYLEGTTLAEIGRRLGVTESRVCRIRKDALAKARSLAA